MHWGASGKNTNLFKRRARIMRIAGMTCAAAMLGVLSTCPTTGFAQTPPANGQSNNQVTSAPRRGARRPPITPEEQAQIAKLAELPAWKPGDGDGDYSIGPDYSPAPEQKPKAGVPEGKIISFDLNAADSKFYPPTGLRGTRDTRKVTVYIPSQYKPGTAAPFIVSADAYGSGRRQLPNILDNMIAEHRLPAMVAVMVQNGGGDGVGSERGLEYDTVSGKFAEFIEAEVLPRVEKECNVTLTKDPDGRMTLGGSSGGAVAFTMAWFHPEQYHRVLVYSGTFVNQQSPRNPQLPGGAWEYHEHLIPNSPTKPLRIWLEVGEHDGGYNTAASGLHNWVLANQRMAEVLKAKGYHYQFIYAKNAGHTDGKVISQTYPETLEYVWKGYEAK